MFSFLGAFQFLNPWLLLGAFVTPVLIYAYRRKSPRLKSVVSSIVVLKLLTPRAAPKTKFKPPLRFFLELLALLLLCAAAAMPVTIDEEERFALLIDNSLSMRAYDGTSSLPATRLERAKTSAHNWLSEHEQSAKIDVFSSSPKLSRVGADSQTVSVANNSIDLIKATTAGDNLEAAISELAESGKYRRVLVVSDKVASFGERKAAENSLFSDARTGKVNTRVLAINVGEPVSNVFLSGLALLSDPLTQGGGKLVATLGYSGIAASEAEISFWELGESERLLDRKTLQVSPGDSLQVSSELPIAPVRNPRFRAEVRKLKGQAGSKDDSISEDNVAWLVPSSAAGERLLLVADENVLPHSGLESLPAFAIERVSPEKFTERSLDDYKLIIFHRSAPSTLPQKPTLLILPPEENSVYPAKLLQADAQISSWVAEHPITSYLKVPLLRLQNAEVFALPSWAEGVIRIEKGPIVVAGESHGIRSAAVGMELFPFEGMKTPAASVLTLNLLNWLSGGGELSGSNLTESSVSLEGGKKWRVEEPGGTGTSAQGSLRLKLPGLYTLSSPAGERRQIAANAFFPGESNTAQKAEFSTPAELEHERKLEQGSKLWWRQLITTALLLLLLEQLLYFLPASLSKRGKPA